MNKEFCVFFLPRIWVGFVCLTPAMADSRRWEAHSCGGKGHGIPPRKPRSSYIFQITTEGFILRVASLRPNGTFFGRGVFPFCFYVLSRNPSTPGVEVGGGGVNPAPNREFPAPISLATPQCSRISFWLWFANFLIVVYLCFPPQFGPLTKFVSWLPPYSHFVHCTYLPGHGTANPNFLFLGGFQTVFMYFHSRNASPDRSFPESFWTLFPCIYPFMSEDNDIAHWPVTFEVIVQ